MANNLKFKKERIIQISLEIVMIRLLIKKMICSRFQLSENLTIIHNMNNKNKTKSILIKIEYLSKI